MKSREVHIHSSCSVHREGRRLVIVIIIAMHTSHDNEPRTGERGVQDLTQVVDDYGMYK